jgi:hypothetical protein
VSKRQVQRLCSFLLLVLPLGCSYFVVKKQIVSILPQSIQFPNQGVGTTSSAYTVTLKGGIVPLTISSIQASAPFAQTNNCGTTLAPSQNCTINVTFTPAASQNYSSSLVIADSATNSPQSVALSGSGLEVIPITFSATQISFPDEAEGTTSTAHSITMTNHLPTAISISSVQTSAPFAQTNTCGTSLAGGASLYVECHLLPVGTAVLQRNIDDHRQCDRLAAGYRLGRQWRGAGFGDAKVSPLQ